MRLDKYLAHSLELTRSQVKKLIKEQRITINDDVCKNAAFHVQESDEVAFDDRIIRPLATRYIMLNKPEGAICSNSADGGHIPVHLLIDDDRVEPIKIVGRLDVDTTGLLLLTDDGQWLHEMMAPSKRCAKVYYVTLDRPLAGNEAELFREGIMLQGEDKPTRPADLDVVSDTEVRLTIYEGRYHQVKRMFAAVGNHVVALHRERVGSIVLDQDLAPGEWRYLTEDEVKHN